MAGLNIPRHNIPTPQEAFSQMMGLSKSNDTEDIVHIPFDNLTFYENQNFRMYDEEESQAMAEDIKINGILSPAIVRPLKDGTYEVLAGRNRTNGAKLAGLPDMLCRLKQADDVQAELIVNGSNLCQRKNLLPSEKAYGYAKYEKALKQMGGATSSRTTSTLSMQTGESKKSIQRYLRLAEIYKPLMTLVDEGKIQVNAGVELAYLSLDSQEALWQYLSHNEHKQKISVPHAKKFREMEEQNETLSPISIQRVFRPQRESSRKIVLQLADVFPNLPLSLQEDGYEEYILKAIAFYKDNS